MNKYKIKQAILQQRQPSYLEDSRFELLHKTNQLITQILIIPVLAT